MLVQDAAHASLLRSTQQQLHAQLYQVELPGPKLPVTAGVEADRGRSRAGVDWHAPRQYHRMMRHVMASCAKPPGIFARAENAGTMRSREGIAKLAHRRLPVGNLGVTIEFARYPQNAKRPGSCPF